MNNDLMFSSKTDLWSTPNDFFNALHKVFNFTLDVCATEENHKCERYFTPEMDGLKQAWEGVCWMNPPYGATIGQWIAKAFHSGLQGATVVCLIPARTDTRYWHDYCIHGEIYFVKGRLKFGNAKSCAPFPSAVVCFRPKIADAFKKSSHQDSLFESTETCIL